MRTVLVHHANPPLGIAKHDQVFAQDPRMDGISVGFAHLFAQANRYPEIAHQLPHRRVPFNAAEQFVLFIRQHTPSSSSDLSARAGGVWQNNYIRDLSIYSMLDFRLDTVTVQLALIPASLIALS